MPSTGELPPRPPLGEKPPRTEPIGAPGSAGEKGERKSATRSIEDIGRDLSRLAGHAQELVALELQRIGAHGRRLLVRLVLALTAGVVGIVLLATAAVLVMRGLIGATSALLDVAPWAASLIVGSLILAAAVAGVGLALHRADRRKAAEVTARSLQRSGGSA